MTRKEIHTRLMDASECSFAVEDRFTNLRVWVSHDGSGRFKKGMKPDLIYMRLDKANSYSVPFVLANLNYLDTPPKTIIELSKLMDFTAPIDKLDEVLDLLVNLKERACIVW